jgi:Proteasome activator PA28, C-terminal
MYFGYLYSNHRYRKQEVLSELHRSQESGYNLRDHPRTNHLNRAKICSKLIKYPNIEDYAVCFTFLTRNAHLVA